MNLDRLDLKIIDILQRDRRITNLELAEKVGLSPTPCLNRVKKLETAGIISGYAAVIDPIAAGYEICAFILVQINNHTRKAGEEFTAAVAKSPAIVEYNMISGKLDYLLRVYAKNLSHYEEILQDQISELPHIASLESLFVLNAASQPRVKISLENSPLLQPKR